MTSWRADPARCGCRGAGDGEGPTSGTILDAGHLVVGDGQ